jgi:hypothetical protein
MARILRDWHAWRRLPLRGNVRLTIVIGTGENAGNRSALRYKDVRWLRSLAHAF